MKKLLLIPLVMMLVGCPTPRYVDIHNNSGQSIFVWMKVGYKLREYQIDTNTWWSLGSPQDFTDHIQVEVNGDVLYLEGAGPRPVPANTSQPEGFPLHGTVPDWLEKK